MLLSNAVPWSAEKEAAEGEACAKYFLGNIDAVVLEAGLGWTELLEISLKRVGLQSISHLERLEYHLAHSAGMFCNVVLSHWTMSMPTAHTSRCRTGTPGCAARSSIKIAMLTSVCVCCQIWKYQPRMKTQLLHVLRSLEAADKPTIAIHVKAHGNTPVQVPGKV